MAGTPTALSQIKARLTADGSLTALLTGGVWDRDLSRRGPYATLAAFEATPGQGQKPALVLIDGGETPDAFYKGAVVGHVDLWLYAAKDLTGANAALLANAYELVKGLLFGWRFPTGNATGGAVEFVGDRLGVRDDPAELGRIFDRATARYSALWRVLS
jgi:hypothetical protein